MLHNSPEMPQHVILALDHHRQLLEEAQRQRQWIVACASNVERPLRWRRLRVHVGELLINLGQRLKVDGTDATDTVWG